MDFAIADLMFFELRRKILAEVIGKTENFSNFVLGNHSGKIFVNVIIGHYKFTNFSREYQENQPFSFMLNG